VTEGVTSRSAAPGIPAPSPDRTTTALVLVVVGLAAFNVARNQVVPGEAQLGANLLAAGAVAVVAWWAALGADELGLRRDRLGAGARYGGVVVAVVVLASLVVAVVPALRPALDDDRVDVGPPALAFEVGVSIPFGTVLLEELAFRGVLLALLLRRTTGLRAAGASSLLFGSWHVLPALTATDANDALGAVAATSAGLALAVGGTVAATTAAGLGLCWLRLRSGSLLAPAIAHLAVNGVAFTVAWAVAR
jgi:uncharacterized protein